MKLIQYHSWTPGVMLPKAWLVWGWTTAVRCFICFFLPYCKFMETYDPASNRIQRGWHRPRVFVAWGYYDKRWEPVGNNIEYIIPLNKRRQ